MDWLIDVARALCEIVREPLGFLLLVYAPLAIFSATILGCFWLRRKARSRSSFIGVALYGYAGSLVGVMCASGGLTWYFFDYYHPAYQFINGLLSVLGYFIPLAVLLFAIRRGYRCTWIEALLSLAYSLLILLAAALGWYYVIGYRIM